MEEPPRGRLERVGGAPAPGWRARSLFFRLFWKDRFASRSRDLREMYLWSHAQISCSKGGSAKWPMPSPGASWRSRLRPPAAAGVPRSFWKWKQWTPATWRDRKPFLQRKNMPALWQNPNRVGPPERKRQRIRRSRKLDNPMEGERKRKRQEGEKLVENLGQGEGDGERKGETRLQEGKEVSSALPGRCRASPSGLWVRAGVPFGWPGRDPRAR